jgi:hypothetical protein
LERSFKKEVEALKLGDGKTFRGEGIMAVTKALLQSGVSYVGVPKSAKADLGGRPRNDGGARCQPTARRVELLPTKS